jgi:hypothetical protein
VKGEGFANKEQRTKRTKNTTTTSSKKIIGLQAQFQTVVVVGTVYSI